MKAIRLRWAFALCAGLFGAGTAHAETVAAGDLVVYLNGLDVAGTTITWDSASFSPFGGTPVNLGDPSLSISPMLVSGALGGSATGTPPSGTASGYAQGAWAPALSFNYDGSYICTNDAGFCGSAGVPYRVDYSYSVSAITGTSASLLPLSLGPDVQVAYALDGVIVDCNPGVSCAGRINLNAFRSWSTPVGGPVTVSADVEYAFPSQFGSVPQTATVTFDHVTTAGSTTIVTTTTEAGDLPSNIFISEQTPYFNITTDAVFDGDVVVCLSYTPGVNGECMQDLLHKADGASEFVNVTLSGTSEKCPYRDDALAAGLCTYTDRCISRRDFVICGIVTDLSPFVVVTVLDDDGDGVNITDGADSDNCPNDANADQLDSDGDGAGDACDACPNDAQNDADGDGLCGDVDACPSDAQNDADGDGVCGDLDQCSGDDLSGDADLDGICNDSDDCYGDNVTGDTDLDGVCNDEDVCDGDDASGDTDQDGICNNWDQCQGDDASGDSDADLVCDDLDVCDGDDATGDTDQDGTCDGSDACPLDAANDSDADGVCGDVDQCLGDDVTGDTDGDQVCDDQDLCIGNDSNGDSDGDGTCDGIDNCPNTANADQADDDGDEIGNVCEADSDGDGVIDDNDNCVNVINSDQTDADGDLVGDTCDDDDDNDGVLDADDNCPLYHNPDQADFDQDGFGDVCDGDDDADGVLDDVDLCPGTPLAVVFNADGCSGAQLVEHECATPDDWNNHGQYVACVVHASKTAHREGLLTRSERARIVRHAAWSGWKAYRRRICRWR